MTPPRLIGLVAFVIGLGYLILSPAGLIPLVFGLYLLLSPPAGPPAVS